jgi:uncharacterized membrane protein YfcA
VTGTTIAVIAIMFAAALLRGLSGFGNALVAMPLLALVIPVRLATPVVAATATCMAVVMLARNWREVHVSSAWRLVLAAAAGTPLGLWFLKGAHEEVVQIVLAAVIAVFAVHSLVRPRPRHVRGGLSTVVAGFSAGVLGGAYNTNGPPIVIYGTLRGWTPEEFRATLQGFFLPAGVVIIAGHVLAGLWTSETVTYTLISLPPTAIGLALSYLVAPCIPRERFAIVVHCLLMACAALLVFKALAG